MFFKNCSRRNKFENEHVVGIEPTKGLLPYPLTRRGQLIQFWSHVHKKLEPNVGNDPTFIVYETMVLPLN